jgi:hypothetical protein
MRTYKYRIGSKHSGYWDRCMDHHFRIRRYSNHTFQPHKYLYRNCRNGLYAALDDHQCPVCGFHGRCKYHLQPEPDNGQCRA